MRLGPVASLLAATFLLAVSATPASARAEVETILGYDVILPDGWLVIELDAGNMIFPSWDKEKYGTETEVVIMKPVKRQGRSDQELIDLLLHQRADGGELFPITDLVTDTDADFDIVRRDYIVNDHHDWPLRFLGVAVIDDPDGKPFVISYESTTEAGFFWAGYMAGLTMGSIHTDLSTKDLESFELPDDIYEDLDSEDEESDIWDMDWEIMDA